MIQNDLAGLTLVAANSAFAGGTITELEIAEEYQLGSAVVGFTDSVALDYTGPGGMVLNVELDHPGTGGMEPAEEEKQFQLKSKLNISNFYFPQILQLYAHNGFPH